MEMPIHSQKWTICCVLQQVAGLACGPTDLESGDWSLNVGKQDVQTGYLKNFLVQLNVHVSSLSSSTDFFIVVCDATKISKSMAKPYSLVKLDVFWDNVNNVPNYEKLFP